MLARRREQSLFGRGISRKVIALVTAGTLVASLGYFHLWGAIPAEAFGSESQVKVAFIFDDHTQVKVEGAPVAARETMEVSTGRDLSFEVSTEPSWQIDQVAASALMPIASPQEARQEAIAANYDETEGIDSASTQIAGVLNEPFPNVAQANDVEVETDPDPIPETAAILQARSDDDIIEVAEEELVEDEAVPMAGAPADLPATEVTEITVIYNEDKNEYSIAREELEKVADAEGSIEVNIETSQSDEMCESWQDIETLLASEDGGGKAKLTSDIEATSSIVVKGDKTLDLNGYHITVAEPMDALFVVGSGATLTIADSGQNAKAVAFAKPDALKGELVPKPADDLEGFRKAVGKPATYDDQNKTLEYFVTRSYIDRPSKGLTEEYLYQYDFDLSGAGTIEARQARSLVSVDGGTLNVTGGLLTMKDGEHAIALKGGAMEMSGGFLVGCEGASGAAVSAKSSTITVGGDAILAGNVAKGNSNGGAFWVENSTLTVGGQAVLAGNKAGNVAYKDTTPGSMAQVRNGGAIYASSTSTVTITDESILSGNVANADGGAVYLQGRMKNAQQGKSSLTVSGSALITNNRSENDKTDIHPTTRPESNANVNWKQYGGGGAGIFSMDETVIDEGAQLTGNYASDGGGALMVTAYAKYEGSNWKGQYAYPLLKVESGVFASNYAGTSEGGGINAITDKESYIKAGYITNNATATSFDYGGGGLFLSSATHGKETSLTVRYPLVTQNTARGFGGGVGICTNGVVVTSDAAVFDNEARQENATTNPNEFGDQWVYDQSTYQLEIDDHAADDLFCAKETTVFNAMLGGGYHRWTGYTDGTVSSVSDEAKYAGTISARRSGPYNSKTTNLHLDGKDLSGSKIPNVLYDPQTHVAQVYLPQAEGTARNFEDYYADIHVKGVGSATYPDGDWAGRVTASEESAQDKQDAPGFVKYELTLQEGAPSPDQRVNIVIDEQPQDLEAFTRTESKKTYQIYHLANKDLFPKTEDAKLAASRLTVLKANPSPEDKAAAVDMAALFFTGNYSNTNGGGIACNDHIVIGRDPESPDQPELPEHPDNSQRLGSLQLVKNLDRFDAAAGSATAVFQITGYVDKRAAEDEVAGLVIYRNTVGITFNPGENQQQAKLLEDLPAGFYRIDEIGYSGDNFTNEKNGRIVEVKEDASADGTLPDPVTVTFSNVYQNESYGTGVVNSYAPKENDQGEFAYADGKLTYTPDANYRNRKEPVAPVEGGE